MQKDESLGLKFVHLPDAAYDRGKSGANRIEARAVARAVFEHFQKYPGKSLGVGTFNIKQQEAILDEVEALQKANPGVDLNSGNERGEHFFVKNLETIQGDERDVILLSVGYGFDTNRKLSLNFGPLNREGGERRLNVLITRAREKCVVFSNFTSRDLPLDENSPFGLKALKVFLEFAESGTLPTPSCGRQELDSPFEEAVSEFLTENGCEVHRQIGCAGYRLDLAVPHPLHPGRYVLGVECDGADYHSSPVARDRDRLRQQVLEGLGWNIYRVWSTDWYLHPKECREKLLETVRESVKQAKLQAKSEPEPELININEPAAWAKTSKTYEINVCPDTRLILPLEGKPLEEPERKTFETAALTKMSSGPDLLSENSLGDPFFVRKVQVEFSPKKKRGSKTPEKAAEEDVEEAYEEGPAGDGEYEDEAGDGEYKDEAGDGKYKDEAGDEESYEGFFPGADKGLSTSSGEDFLPEMTFKAESMATLADNNSRNRHARKAKKSKLLKFSVDPRSGVETDMEEESYLIPEPEPEKINFFQAYPEIDFSAGPEKKRKGRRLNEFAYIYGSGGSFEPDDPEEDDWPDPEWSSEPEIKPEIESEIDSEIESEIESEIKPEIESEAFPGANPQAKTEAGSMPEAKNSRIIEPDSPDNGGEEKLSGKVNSLEALVPPYRVCTSSGLQQSADLSEISDAQLEEAVVNIVEIEGPIHSEEILQRIRSHTGLPRMLGKIRQRILDSIASAESSGKIQVKGEFYWPLSGPADLLRRRDAESYAKIEWICDEEIKEAVRFVLTNQYSTPMEDLIIQTSRVLGIRTTRKNAWDRIEKLIQSGIESNELTRTPNEMIYFVE
jgi:very-short-patch-repair endonuclease